MSGELKQKTNVIYITTKCNLDCTYCYEADKRNAEGFKNSTLTNDDISAYIADLEKRENSFKHSTVVIMGGEPLLEMKTVFNVVHALAESAVKLNKQYHVLLTTNGLQLNNTANMDVYSYLRYFGRLNNVHITTEISYDGEIGHADRVFPNGSPSHDLVLGACHELMSRGIPFQISAVTTKNNCHDLVPETIKILETFKGILMKLKWSIAHEDIDIAFGPGYSKELTKYYTPYMNELYKRYQIPICAMCCKACKQCNSGTYSGNSYLSPTKGIIQKETYTNEAFNQF